MKRITVNSYIMSRLNLFYILSIFIASTIFSCEEEQHSPINKGGDLPEQVTNVKVISTPGGADLVYTLPNSKDLSYIEAIVNTPEGNTLNFKSSTYRDTISITGLATENVQEVLLYSVSKSGLKSQPLLVDINPLTPPYMKVFQTLTLENGLGGVDVKYKNETGDILAVSIGRIIDGEFIEDDTYYSNKKDGRYLFWGYEPIPQQFGVYIRDRWDHYSDTLYANITPTLEIMFDKSNFKAIRLENDSKFLTGKYELPQNMWDGRWSEDYNNPYTDGGTNWSHGKFLEDSELGKPAAFTIDLGQLCCISRIRFNHYWRFENDSPKKYEVYGFMDYGGDYIQYTDGAWHNWELLATVENVKPSSIGGNSNEDAESWEAGNIVTFSPPVAGVRYIRIKAIESWNGKRNLDFAEVTVYGQEIQ